MRGFSRKEKRHSMILECPSAKKNMQGLHAFYNCIAEFRAFNFCCAFHLSRKIVRDGF